jgi:hypothetical protein
LNKQVEKFVWCCRDESAPERIVTTGEETQATTHRLLKLDKIFMEDPPLFPPSACVKRLKGI